MKVLLACDKFKGSLDSIGVNTALAKGLKKKHPAVTTIIHPLADGGDGTLAVLGQILNLPFKNENTIDPLGRPLIAPYLKKGNNAYFELAAASGIALLKNEKLQPLHTTTLGTGRLMRSALNAGASKLVLGLGGSCTTDAGLGIAYELGIRFYDKNKKSILPAGGNLLEIDAIDTTEAAKINRLEILCDVSNPLYGPNGAAHVFARQKGATEREIDLLDRGLRHVAQRIEDHTGRSIANLSGGGAAGGIAAGLAGLFGAEILNGFEFIKKITDLEAEVAKADLVITGEGQLDKTSLNGKVVGGVAAICQQYNRPLIVIVGASQLTSHEEKELGIHGLYTVLEKAGSVELAMKNTAYYLQKIGASLSLDNS